MINSRQSRIESLNEIIDGLFIGDHIAAANKYILNRHGITHVLTIGEGMYPKFPDSFIYKWIVEKDSATANLAQHFTACHSFIKDALSKGGRILVHSYAGISRSATIVISFFMKKDELLDLAAAT